MKNIVSMILLICIFLAMGTTASAERGDKENSIGTEIMSCSGGEKNPDTNDLLKTEEDIQHYAYLDLNSADPFLVPVILKAREKIIFSQSWVADGVQGFVCDNAGNIIEEVPNFSELFPTDWTVPVLPTGVDLSYYGK